MAKLSIDKESLVAIGDALRAHFGETVQEGTTSFQPETPKIIKTPNYDNYGIEENNGEYLAAITTYNGMLIDTIKIHGASKIVLNLSYRTNNYYGNNIEDFIWVAEGAHRYYQPNKGHTLKYHESLFHVCPNCGGNKIQNTGIELDVGYYGPTGEWITEFSARLHVCNDCGLQGFCYSPGDPFTGNPLLQSPQGFKNQFAESWEARRTMKTFAFNGDTFTFGIHNWGRNQETGYYGEIYAYDADGNELMSYDITTGYLPNTYTPDIGSATPNTMAWAISKLNNYPNGEEVRF